LAEYTHFWSGYQPLRGRKGNKELISPVQAAGAANFPRKAAIDEQKRRHKQVEKI
jgi:hypothetical protein